MAASTTRAVKSTTASSTISVVGRQRDSTWLLLLLAVAVATFTSLVCARASEGGEGVGWLQSSYAGRRGESEATPLSPLGGDSATAAVAAALPPSISFWATVRGIWSGSGSGSGSDSVTGNGVGIRNANVSSSGWGAAPYVAPAVLPLPLEASDASDVTWWHTILPSLLGMPLLIAGVAAAGPFVTSAIITPTTHRAAHPLDSRRGSTIVPPLPPLLLLAGSSLLLHGCCVLYWAAQARQFNSSSSTSASVPAWMGGWGWGGGSVGVAWLLRLGLPRLVMGVWAGGTAALAALGAASKSSLLSSKLMGRQRWTSKLLGDQCPSPPIFTPLLPFPSLALLTVSTPALSLLLGPSSPALLLCACVHALALGVLLRIAAVTIPSTTGATSTTAVAAPVSTPRGARPSGSAASPLAPLLSGPVPLVAILWSCLVTHYYAGTGHASVFSSLSFGAAFIGWDDYAPGRSGLMLAGNTYAAHWLLLACVGGPLVVGAAGPTSAAAEVAVAAAAAEGEASAAGAPSTSAARVGRGGSHPRSTSPSTPPSPSFPSPSPARSLSLPLLVVMPLASLAATALFCAVERRHLMVWAVFAPKFVFEAVGAAAAVGCVAAGAAVMGHGQ